MCVFHREASITRDPDPLGAVVPWGGEYMFRSYFDYLQALIYVILNFVYRKNVFICGPLTSWGLSDWANSVTYSHNTYVSGKTAKDFQTSDTLL